MGIIEKNQFSNQSKRKIFSTYAKKKHRIHFNSNHSPCSEFFNNMTIIELVVIKNQPGMIHGTAHNTHNNRVRSRAFDNRESPSFLEIFLIWQFFVNFFKVPKNYCSVRKSLKYKFCSNCRGKNICPRNKLQPISTFKRRKSCI